MLQLQRSGTPTCEEARAATKLSGEACGALINLSGRRRFTSQRIVLYSVLASLGDAQALDTAREALTLFRDAHIALMDGKGELPGVFCEELREACFGTLRGDEHIWNFIRLAERILDAMQANYRQAPALLEELVQSATPMLAILNRITAIYEEQSKRYALQVKKQLRGIMSDIETIAKQARMVAFNAQIVAARAGEAGREFSVVASVLSGITGEIDGLVREALNGSAA
ncbi:methyl-accepting chemotaxis protein [Noviherbaspirillum cavernae]|uniref:Methyl-accepting chemotaxis protein n=1 Tax=Noviherbaspirillum cavernae TaxID=2320862 RepID=A0A418X326_9BURK|nr:methyl-accepting chemotaxis protein [Noviherbaspirillum cavernae]RJG06867.1 methyl-accepting chemotaxis protein [Noviherbaspirillum cavernae]